MADKDLALVNGATGTLSIKPTFEGKVLAPNKVSIDVDNSDLKGLITVGALVAGADGAVDIPVTAVAVGTQEATVVFKYADAGDKSDVENWGFAVKTLALTITEAILARLIDVSTPLTMDLWATQPLTFKVVKGTGEAENDISPSITSVTVDPESIVGKFEFTSNEGAYSFKSIQSATDAVVTATAKLTVVGTHEGTPYSLTADVVLNTNINDGSIPTNRFDVQFVE